MAKPHAGLNAQRQTSARSTAAASARTTAGPSAPDPTLPTPTSIPRADLSASGAKPRAASANRSSAGSSSSASAADLPAPAAGDIASIAKEVAKCLDYNDDAAFPTSISKLQPLHAPEGIADLAPLVELPDPDDASSTVVSASPSDAVDDSADSAITQVAAPVDSTADADRPLLTEMEHVLAELGSARGLSLRSKRLLTTLVEVANAELNATALRMRRPRADLWRNVRVGILAATVFSVATMDVALAVALFGRYHHVMPPT